MNRTTNLAFLIMLTLFISLQLNSKASADHTNDPYVNYDLLCRHADDLQYIAVELKDSFSDQFRGNRYYGKLISRAARIKNAAKRLHRRGLSKSACNWRAEIQALNDLVYELDSLVDQSIYYARSGYGTPICKSGVRKVRGLLSKADYHVRGLEESLRRIEQTNKVRTNNQPVHFEAPAPGYFPTSQGIGAGVYRSGYRGSVNRRGSCDDGRCYDSTGFSNSNRSRGYRGSDVDRGGLAVNVGGLKFYLK